jgi:hypothetical protein
VDLFVFNVITPNVSMDVQLKFNVDPSSPTHSSELVILATVESMFLLTAVERPNAVNPPLDAADYFHKKPNLPGSNLEL